MPKLGTYRRTLVSVSPAGVAHRTPWMEMRTLCGISIPLHAGWRSAVGDVTCERCLAQSRRHSTATTVL